MKRRRHISVESIMVTLLLIILAASVSILIYEGSITYQSILSDKDNQENARVALSFVNMKIKQNDVAGHITLIPYQDNYAIMITHTGEEAGLYTYIYEDEGILWECYTDGDLMPDYSEPIVETAGISFSYNSNHTQIVTQVTVPSDEASFIMTGRSTLRSSGQGVDL